MSFLGRLRSVFSRSTPRTAPTSSEPQIIPDQSLWMQFQRIGGNLTPADVTSIIRTADSGYTWRLVDLGNEMRQKDGHLHCVLQTREQALAQLRWELVFPGQKPKSKRGKKQRAFVQSVLETHPEFRSLLAHLMGGIFNGYAVAETVWGVKKGQMVPDRFVLHSPRRFGFRQLDGKLVWRDVDMSQEGVDFQAENPDRFVVSQPRVNGDVAAREGLIRCLMWLALFRNWTLSDWLKLAEIAWKPWRLGKYSKKENASKEDRAKIEAILAGMSSSGVAVYPDTVEVELRWPDGGAATGRSDHHGLIEFAGREMSKAVLGQTLTTEQGAIGSQALGNVHNDVRLAVRDSDALHIADVITRCIIEPMIRLNFGPNAPVPRLRFITEEAADMQTFALGLKTLVNDCGLKVGSSYAYDQLGIPEPLDGEELLGVWSDVDLSGLDESAANDPTPPDESKLPAEEQAA